MDLILCSLCLLMLSAVKKTNTQNWDTTPEMKHREQGITNVVGLEPKTVPRFYARNVYTRTESRSSIVNKPIPFHKKDQAHKHLPSEQINVTCSDSKLRVEVRKDFWGPETPHLTSADLSLGEACKSNEDTADTIVFNYGLNTCGTKRSVTNKEFVYSNFLLNTPSTGLLPQERNITAVHCHYERGAVKAIQRQELMQRSITGHFDFSLDVMSEDWQSKSNASIYFLGQTINLRVSINLHNHFGFKVYVDSCVASTSQDPGLGKSYSIIQDYGCLTNSMATRSKAKFLSPRSDHTLRFQIKAFQFKGYKHDLIFIHCAVKVSDSQAPPSDQSKSCQYDAETGRWDDLEGQQSLCDCCEMHSCGKGRRQPRHISPLQLEVVVGPLYILPVDDIQSWPPMSRAPWDTLSHSPGGMWRMTVVQLVAVCASVICTLCALVGLLCLCLHGQLCPVHKAPSHPSQ
ncbi:zona pellucida sperm-binding protein 3-like isoform X2 [Conger conger]|uniref:zona pellucida sperm-binding protein 3-like isoform X2 n=1 Tax=Conger conger TaxID=82655 RepID=UPI002A599CC4|nr:zona pellucida sperm-binding protein 3-like isoform X2 [Conger conger]